MNLDLDLSILTRFLRGTLAELRQKKLWPLAGLLLVALVAIPLLLSRSSTPAPVAQTPLPTPPPSPATTLPTISEQSTPTHSQLTGPAHDPFAASGSGAGAASTTPSSPTTTSTVAFAAVSTANRTAQSALNSLAGALSTGSATGSQSVAANGVLPVTGSGSASGSSSFAPRPATPTSEKSHTSSPGLTSTQAYQVALAITNPAGGLSTIYPLQRLSALPADQQPLLVELGVLKGGNRVLFAVQPGTAVMGPATCIPGPLDCEVLSVAPGQTEAIGVSSGGGFAQTTLFAVTQIRTVDYPSASAAQRARRMVSAFGQRLLRNSPLSALSLFAYEPGLGALVDLRNLTVVGG